MHCPTSLHGAQIMAYGKTTGEPYLSDITLAFLEDTGHYRIVNGSGGSLTADLAIEGQCSESGSTAYLDYIFGNTQYQDVRLSVLTACWRARYWHCLLVSPCSCRA
jgi:hypothetical protein